MGHLRDVKLHEERKKKVTQVKCQSKLYSSIETWLWISLGLSRQCQKQFSLLLLLIHCLTLPLSFFFFLLRIKKLFILFYFFFNCYFFTLCWQFYNIFEWFQPKFLQIAPSKLCQCSCKNTIEVIKFLTYVLMLGPVTTGEGFTVWWRLKKSL